MIRIVNGIKLDIPSHISHIRVRRNPDRVSINYYENSIVITGKSSGDFKGQVILDEKPITDGDYTTDINALKIGKVTITPLSLLPVRVSIVVVTRGKGIVKVVESEEQLVVVVNDGTTEDQLVDMLRDCRYYQVTGGSSDRVGNLILCEVTGIVDRDWSHYGEYNLENYRFPTISAGIVTSEFLKLIKDTFPDFSVVPFGDQDAARKNDYIEYVITQFDKYRRPFIESDLNRTLLSHFIIKLDFVIKDTVKYMNILQDIRAVELLTNLDVFYAKDKAGRLWKCSMDWQDVYSEPANNQVRGNYGKQAGNLISVSCQIRHFSLPDINVHYYPIKQLEQLKVIAEIDKKYVS